MKWHPELFCIYKKLDSSRSGLSRLYRLRTKKQIKWPTAGGTSIAKYIPFSQHRLVTKKNKEYLQVTQWYYEKEKLFFQQIMTFNDELALKLKASKVKQLDSFFR